MLMNAIQDRIRVCLACPTRAIGPGARSYCNGKHISSVTSCPLGRWELAATMAGRPAAKKPGPQDRMAQCTRGACRGRLCRWLVKQQGLLGVFCGHPGNARDGESLYGLHEDPAWHCPDKRF
jgi:hypothetical protein